LQSILGSRNSEEFLGAQKSRISGIKNSVL